MENSRPRVEINHGRGRPSSRLRARLRLGARCGEGRSRDVAAQVWRANCACSQPGSISEPRLLFATGSESHLDQLQTLAKKKGLNLDANGLRRNGKVIAARTEKEIYEALGLPVHRTRAARRTRGDRSGPEKIACRSWLHTTTFAASYTPTPDASDGVNTLKQMAEATRKRGFSYFGVADHSKSAHYAGGLTVEQIVAQHDAVDELNARYGESFRVFKGIESDILADGSLDYSEEILNRFDFVVASVHGQFRKDRASQTERILRAVANPHTTILGHMTGRQLLRRPGYDVDVERILAACAEHGVAVEINANPWRLDLDWRWHQKAIDLGCWFSINPDAHSTAEIDLTKWGVAMARKGGVSPERVLNALDLATFAAHLEARKARTQANKRLRARASIAATSSNRSEEAKAARNQTPISLHRKADRRNSSSMTASKLGP